MNNEEIKAFVMGPLRSYVMQSRKLVNDATNSRNVDTLKIIGSFGLSIFCMSAAFMDLTMTGAFQALQTELSKEYLDLSLEQQQVISNAINKMIQETNSASNN